MLRSQYNVGASLGIRRITFPSSRERPLGTALFEGMDQCPSGCQSQCSQRTPQDGLCIVAGLGWGRGRSWGWGRGCRCRYGRACSGIYIGVGKYAAGFIARSAERIVKRAGFGDIIKASRAALGASPPIKVSSRSFRTNRTSLTE